MIRERCVALSAVLLVCAAAYTPPPRGAPEARVGGASRTVAAETAPVDAVTTLLTAALLWLGGGAK